MGILSVCVQVSVFGRGTISICVYLPESDSTSCFFCIFHSNHEPETLLLPWQTHTNICHLILKPAKSAHSFSSYLQLDYTLRQPSSDFVTLCVSTSHHCTLNVCVSICCLLTEIITVLETEVSLNNTQLQSTCITLSCWTNRFQFVRPKHNCSSQLACITLNHTDTKVRSLGKNKTAAAEYVGSIFFRGSCSHSNLILYAQPLL